MSRRTLILIVVLIGITAVLLAIALTPKQAPSPPLQKQTENNLSYAQTTLRISNNPTQVISTSSAVPLYSTDVIITTGGSKVNAVQLELAFDVAHLYNVDIKPGPLFQNSVELLKKVDNQKGTISYALAGGIGQEGVRGGGTVAVITFQEKGKAGELARINFLPKTLVTAQGIDKSVLKTAVDATFPIAPASASSPPQNIGTQSAQ